MPRILMRPLEIARTLAHSRRNRDLRRSATGTRRRKNDATNRVVRMLRKNVRQQVRHPLFHSVRVRVHQRADAQYRRVSVTYRLVVARVSPPRDVAALRKPHKPVLKIPVLRLASKKRVLLTLSAKTLRLGERRKIPDRVLIVRGKNRRAQDEDENSRCCHLADFDDFVIQAATKHLQDFDNLDLRNDRNLAEIEYWENSAVARRLT
ncbi:hypothetical protein C0993_012273 [Termitomyces sp. T159_Od127]|nr:hypothetical protein C0993_012273 [Termitomyces sp. T159_Od127]